MTKLKPCPFCGGSAELRIVDNECWPGLERFQVRCTRVGTCPIAPAAEFPTEYRAVVRWNTRTRPQRAARKGKR